jgi:hypothetical protein
LEVALLVVVALAALLRRAPSPVVLTASSGAGACRSAGRNCAVLSE